MTFILAILFIMFVLGPIARALAASIERSGEKRALESRALDSDQLLALGEELRSLAERVDRLSEEQSFLLRVMEEEPKLLEEPVHTAPPAGEDTDT